MDRVGDRRRRGSHGGLARATDFCSGRLMICTWTAGTSLNRRIGLILPAPAGDAFGGEFHFLLQRPARRLNGAALDLVDHAVGFTTRPTSTAIHSLLTRTSRSSSTSATTAQ